jgi:hypothetical protein
MSHSLRNFSIRLAIFSVFTLALMFGWQQFLPAKFQSSLLWIVWLFFVGSTALIHYILTNAAEKDPRRFVGYYMGITAIKLFGYLILIVAYALVKREAALGFTLWFLTMYLLYSGFEVVMLMKYFNKK